MSISIELATKQSINIRPANQKPALKIYLNQNGTWYDNSFWAQVAPGNRGIEHLKTSQRFHLHY